MVQCAKHNTVVAIGRERKGEQHAATAMAADGGGGAALQPCPYAERLPVELAVTKLDERSGRARRVPCAELASK